MSMKAKLFWATRGETIEKQIGDTKISRDIKIGMTVEGDSGEKSEDLHLAVTRAINVAFEKEREEWMCDKAMEIEVERLKTMDRKTDEDGSSISDKDKKEENNSKDVRSLTENGEF